MCEDGTEIASAWSGERGGLLLGWSLSKQPNRASWVFSRIERTTQGTNLLIMPRDGPRSEFTAAELKEREILFESASLPFPRRIRYRRNSQELIVSLEGEMNGRQAAIEQRFSQADLNQGCDKRVD
jgi:hypothetical protein